METLKEIAAKLTEIADARREEADYENKPGWGCLIDNDELDAIRQAAEIISKNFATLDKDMILWNDISWQNRETYQKICDAGLDRFAKKLFGVAREKSSRNFTVWRLAMSTISGQALRDEIAAATEDEIKAAEMVSNVPARKHTLRCALRIRRRDAGTHNE